MLLLIKLGKCRALSIEINREFGVKPFFHCKRINNQLFIDTILSRTIYAPEDWQPKRSSCYDQKTNDKKNDTAL